MIDDTSAFEEHRPALLALAYRMLGDMARAEDVVQEAWLRWQGHAREVDVPKAFLIKTVTRLCLNELDSARVRREESRGDWLPEPVALDEAGLGKVEVIDQISMAFLVVLQRLTPAERAVLLLHDVFDLSHAEIAQLLQRSEAACRQLLSRAKENVSSERRVFRTSREEHRRLLLAFVQASGSGQMGRMLELLADDAVMVIDTGPEGRRVGRIRNVGRPVVGARRIAAFLAAVARERPDFGSVTECSLNGQPAIVRLKDGRPVAAILISVAEGRIRHVFVQADERRLTHLGLLQ
jgi:RNA polymerase sigma-70 factor (ECF subfamily)